MVGIIVKCKARDRCCRINFKFVSILKCVYGFVLREVSYKVYLYFGFWFCVRGVKIRFGDIFIFNL